MMNMMLTKINRNLIIAIKAPAGRPNFNQALY